MLHVLVLCYCLLNQSVSLNFCLTGGSLFLFGANFLNFEDQFDNGYKVLLMLLLCISKSRNECALRIDVYTLIVCLLNVKIPQYTIIPEKYLFDGLF